jgi:hypothetical protein
MIDNWQIGTNGGKMYAKVGKDAEKVTVVLSPVGV